MNRRKKQILRELHISYLHFNIYSSVVFQVPWLQNVTFPRVRGTCVATNEHSDEEGVLGEAECERQGKRENRKKGGKRSSKLESRAPLAPSRVDDNRRNGHEQMPWHAKLTIHLLLATN